MTWAATDPQGDETGKIRWELVPYTKGRGLDVGCGPSQAFPHFTRVDNNKDTQLFNIQFVPDIRTDADKLDMFASQSMDFVFSSHTLEHIKEHKKALREWWRVLKLGGYLCLYLPHKDFYPNIGKEGCNPDHVHDFLPQDIIDAMEEIGGWDLVENQERNEGKEYSFFQVYKKFANASIHKFSHDKPKPEKTCAIIRYGAWGDVIQTSSILPGLKEQGYHITLFTVPRALEAIKHEPLIDRFVIQDTDQVPNAWLGDYWDYLRPRYDKFINLSESVEGSLLAMPERVQANWTTEARHMVMNLNYLEFTHKLAGVPYKKPLSRFSITDEEKKWVAREKRVFNANPLIMWVLKGSALHKIWSGGEDVNNKATGFDSIIARIMVQWPHAKVIMVGDESAKEIIEAPWVNESRVLRRSGVWSIRETMAMAYHCDMVIGPETGVMSAVAMEPMKKVVFLSHSTEENLTRDWVNTQAMVPVNTPCYPCHKLVYRWEQCNQDGESGIAKCQASITPMAVWDAIRSELDKREAA